MTHIILATTSPYRKEAFSFLGLDFESRGSEVDEYGHDRPDKPGELVLYLARKKAEAVAKHYTNGIVIGFDSVGHFDGRILEKPRSRQEAHDRLTTLSGRVHEFFTGIHMIDIAQGKSISRAVGTKIFIRELRNEEIEAYLDQDPAYSTYALGYDPLSHISSTFAERIEGSYNNFLRGIPLETIATMLDELKAR